MDRLRILVLLSACTLLVGWCGRPVSAQVTGEAHPPCLVIGDVAKPDAYPVTRGADTVSQIVHAAGLSAASANVTILRHGSSPGQWTEFVQRGSTTSSSPVRPGDILIVSHAVPVDSPVTNSAALITEGGTFVLTLSDAEITTSDVLHQCRISVPNGSSVVRLAGNLPGNSPQAASFDVVRHGDVLAVAQAAQVHSSQTNGLNTRVSASPFQTASANATDTHHGLRTVSQETLWTDDAQSASADGRPVINVPTRLPEPAPIGAEDSSNNEWLLPQDAGSYRDSSQPAVDPFVDGSTGRANQSPANKNELTAPGLREDTTPITTEAGTVETAPLPPTEATAESGEFGLMNTLFISAMLLAGSLIIAGWIRSELAGNRQEARAKSLKRNGKSDAPTTSRSGETGLPARSFMPAGDILESPTSTSHSIEGLQIPAQPMVPARPTPAQLQFANAIADVQPTSECVLLPARTQQTARTNLVREDEFFGDWRQLSRNEQKADTGASAAATPSRSTGSATTESPEQIITENPADADALEDLIQNRLPVDLCKADLPLKVTVFGRPAGPRRLRVDAAHREIPAPHFPASQRRQHTGDTDAAVAGSSTENTKDSTQDTSAAANSLDRALNYLNGRVNS